MPGLECVHWELCDNEKRDTALRKRLREDFAYTLQTLPSSLQRFNLLYERYLPLDHSFQTPSILDEPDSGNNDKLSLALYKLSQRLATFDLMVVVVVGRQSWFSSATPIFTRTKEVVQIWREAAEEHAGAGLVAVVRDSRAW